MWSLRTGACSALLLAAAGGHRGASATSLRQRRAAGPEEEGAATAAAAARASAHKVRQAADAILSGENPFTSEFATRHAGTAGPFWEYGTCTTSSAWNVPNFGARWPLITGMVSWFDRIEVSAEAQGGEAASDVKGSSGSGSGGSGSGVGGSGSGNQDSDTVTDDTVAYVPRSVYAVLNQAHLSIFNSAHDAEVCGKPERVIDASAMHSVGRGGEPVLVTQQNAEMQDGQSPSFCVHLQLANPNGPGPLTQVFCMPDRRARSDFIAFLNNAIEGRRSDKRLADTTAADGGSSAVSNDPDMFPQPPRTICRGVHAAGFCLTSVAPDIPEEQTGVDDGAVQRCCKAHTAVCLACAQGMSTLDYCKEYATAEGCDATAVAEMNQQAKTKVPDARHNADPADALDAIELRPARWVSSFPVRASKEQTWSVSGVSDKGTVSICHSGGRGRGGGVQSDGDMCISVRKSVSMQGNVDLPVKTFTTCPGEDLRCFEVESVVASKNPSSHDTDACHKACKAEEACHGWVQTRPQAEHDHKAKCCLKKEDTSSECKADRCCDAHMKSMTKSGLVHIDPAVPSGNTALFGVIQLGEKVRRSGGQNRGPFLSLFLSRSGAHKLTIFCLFHLSSLFSLLLFFFLHIIIIIIILPGGTGWFRSPAMARVATFGVYD